MSYITNYFKYFIAFNQKNWFFGFSFTLFVFIFISSFNFRFVPNEFFKSTHDNFETYSKEAFVLATKNDSIKEYYTQLAKYKSDQIEQENFLKIQSNLLKNNPKYTPQVYLGNIPIEPQYPEPEIITLSDFHSSPQQYSLSNKNGEFSIPTSNIDCSTEFDIEENEMEVACSFNSPTITKAYIFNKYKIYSPNFLEFFNTLPPSKQETIKAESLFFLENNNLVPVVEKYLILGRFVLISLLALVFSIIIYSILVFFAMKENDKSNV